MAFYSASSAKGRLKLLIIAFQMFSFFWNNSLSLARATKPLNPFVGRFCACVIQVLCRVLVNLYCVAISFSRLSLGLTWCRLSRCPARREDVYSPYFYVVFTAQSASHALLRLGLSFYLFSRPILMFISSLGGLEGCS